MAELGLPDELRALSYLGLCSAKVASLYRRRVANGDLSRDDNMTSHVCVYFLPLNPETGEVFLVHHKKSGLWLAPGGHVDRGETRRESVAREAGEELGVVIRFDEVLPIYAVTVTEICDGRPMACRWHFDLWHILQTDGSDFHVDPREFLAHRWMPVKEAVALTGDPSNKEVLGRLLRAKPF